MTRTVDNNPPYPTGSITSTPPKVRSKLGIKVMKVKGVVGRGRRKR